MAVTMNQKELGKDSKNEFRQEVYEKVWTISRWSQVQQSEDELGAQIFEFKTDKSAFVQTKWNVGFHLTPSLNQFRIYWKLNHAKGFLDEKLQASTVCKLKMGNSTIWKAQTQNSTIAVGQVIKTQVRSQYKSQWWRQHMEPDGSAIFKLKLTMMEPKISDTEIQTKMFHEVSFAQNRTNFASLLEDKTTADIEIKTSDGHSLFAHKAILKVQCPVFETMFNSNLSECRSGVIEVEDITAKTMKILLHFFYTGEIQPTWKDEDIVVEFTYAVAKYQLGYLLKFMDEVLGSRNETAATNTDVQLLNLANKLDLKIAEKQLIERLRNTMQEMDSGADFFNLWGIVNK